MVPTSTYPLPNFFFLFLLPPTDKNILTISFVFILHLGRKETRFLPPVPILDGQTGLFSDDLSLRKVLSFPYFSSHEATTTHRRVSRPEVKVDCLFSLRP